MRTWERVVYQERCGGCGTLLSAGMPMQTISRHGLNRQLVRCALCADGDVPPALPDDPVHLSVQERLAEIRMRPIQAATPPRTRGAFKEFARE